MRRNPSHDPRTDAELVEAAGGGDTRAFEILYDRHRAWVVRHAYRWTDDRDLALDVLQETFLYLLRRLPDLRLRARMTTLLFPVVRNLSLRQLERRRFVCRSPADLPEIADPRRGPDDLRRLDLQAAVDALPAGQRDVLLLRYADDLKIAAIAATLRIPAGTVKSRLHQALRALRRDPRLRAYFEERDGRAAERPDGRAARGDGARAAERAGGRAARNPVEPLHPATGFTGRSRTHASAVRQR